VPVPPPADVVGGLPESLLLHAEAAALIPKPSQMRFTIFMALLLAYESSLERGKRSGRIGPSRSAHSEVGRLRFFLLSSPAFEKASSGNVDCDRIP